MQHWMPYPACAQHARRLCFFICITATLAVGFGPPVFADAISAYDSWCWNGFTRSSPPPSSSSSLLGSLAALTTTAASSSQSSYETSSSPLSYSALSGSGLTAAVTATGGTASLSGYVYVDVDKDNDAKIDTNDWAIADAKISLTRDGSSDPAAIAYSNKDGSYSFTSLVPGTYSIAMLTPCALPGQDTLGQLSDINGISVNPGKLDNPNDKFYDIAMSDGYTGVNYNFAETAYPISLFSKRMVINTDTGIIHTVPEPGSLVLLVIAGLMFGGAAWHRHRRVLRVAH